MGTKNNPGNFDCYANAEPDEPMFILLGRDKFAPSLVEHWADGREADGEDAEKVEEARQCADAMRKWLTKLGKKEQPLNAVGSYVWACYLAHGMTHSTFYVCTVERNIEHAVRQITAYAEDPDQFTSPAEVKRVEFVGYISA